MQKRRIVIVALVAAPLLLASCAPGANELVSTPDSAGTVAGFWQGLWHGFISLFTVVASIFRDDVGVYEAHNNGIWYDLGFIFGVMCFFGGGGGEASRRKKK